MRLDSERVEQGELFDYGVMDADGNRIGNVNALWLDEQNRELEFVGVKTGWLGGKTHVIPARDASLDDENSAIRVPFREDTIKDAPAFSPDADLSPEQEREVFDWYGLEARPAEMRAREPEGPAADIGPAEEGADVPLAEEELHVGKRQVAGREVHLRKVVRSEHVEEPVELRHEEVEIEREPAAGERVPEDAFQEREYTIQEMDEEPVVEKEAHVAEEVHARKRRNVERETVGGDVRREELEVDRDREQGEWER